MKWPGKEGGRCTCGHSQATQVVLPGGPREAICNLTDCTQPWAVSYRKSIQPRWYERIIGTIVAFLVGRW